MSERSAVINRERLFSLFRDMVDIYSPSGKEEELACFLSDYLERKEFPVCRQPVDETRYNLLVSIGDAVPDTLFFGHIDTVPAFDIEQYGFSVSEGLCRGLGAADMKSGCAAMIEAFNAVREAGRLPDNVLLALVVGEEEAGDGTQALLETHRFEQALVAEPTDVHPCLEHFGYIEMEVSAFGSRRHAAMSDRDTNAIRALLRFLLQLEARVESDGYDSVLNIRDLHSSESGFAVPDCCATGIDLHIPPGISARSYADELCPFVERELVRGGASRYELDFPTLADGFRTDTQERLPRQLQKIYRAQGLPWSPRSFKSHSDANMLRDAGCSPVILGPGQLAKAHTRDESVDFEQVVRAAQIYTLLLADGC